MTTSEQLGFGVNYILFVLNFTIGLSVLPDRIPYANFGGAAISLTLAVLYYNRNKIATIAEGLHNGLQNM